MRTKAFENYSLLIEIVKLYIFHVLIEIFKFYKNIDELKIILQYH